MIFALCFSVAFLSGAIPTAYLAGRRFGKIDIRKHGSGNMGATNAFRVLGRGPGVFVFAVDFLKGYLPVLFYLSRFSAPGSSQAMGEGLWLGLGAVLGHVFTPFLGFKGGKGIATGAGALLACSPFYFLSAAGLWILALLVSRVIAVASLSAVAGLLVLGFLGKEPMLVESYFILAMLLTLWTHRKNLRGFCKKE